MFSSEGNRGLINYTVESGAFFCGGIQTAAVRLGERAGIGMSGNS